MAAGIPLVTTRVVSGEPVDGENGLVAEVDDVDAWAVGSAVSDDRVGVWLRAGVGPPPKPVEDRLDSLGRAPGDRAPRD
jgi:hypothetical protein